MAKLLAVSPDSSELKVYDLYLQRIMKHYELVLQQFNIYFGINLALLTATGILISSDRVAPLRAVLFSHIVPGVSVLGVVVSVAWFAVNRDGRRWQLLMNDVIANLEKGIFAKPGVGLYQRINAEYSPRTRLGLDLIDVNLWVAMAFVVAWLVIGIASPVLGAQALAAQ